MAFSSAGNALYLRDILDSLDQPAGTDTSLYHYLTFGQADAGSPEFPAGGAPLLNNTHYGEGASTPYENEWTGTHYNNQWAFPDGWTGTS